MNWDAVGAIGQVLGSIAVFVTLGYLTIQIRHAREQMSRSARAGRNEALRQYFMYEATHPDRTRDSIDLEQKFGFSNAMVAPWTCCVLQAGGTYEQALRSNFSELVYWSVAEQNISTIDDLLPGERVQFDKALRLIYGGALPTRAKWYETMKDRLNPEAVRYIDALLAQPDSTRG